MKLKLIFTKLDSIVQNHFHSLCDRQQKRKEITTWIPDTEPTLINQHPEDWRRSLISNLWKYYKQAYEMHGFIHLLELGCLIEKRIGLVADQLLNAPELSDTTSRRLKAYALRLDEHWLVLNRMVELYQDEGSITSITNEIHNELSVQLNKGGRPTMYDHESITYPIWKSAYSQSDYRENGRKSEIVDEILDEFAACNEYPDRSLIEKKITEYEQREKESE